MNTRIAAVAALAAVAGLVLMTAPAAVAGPPQQLNTAVVTVDGMA